MVIFGSEIVNVCLPRTTWGAGRAEPEGPAFAVVSRIPLILAMREQKSESREEREVTDPAHFRANAEMCGA